MPEIWNQIAPHRLTPDQKELKRTEDEKYRIAKQQLSHDYYTKKRSVGVSAEETAGYRAAGAKLWEDYVAMAKANGLFERVPAERQLTDLESGLADLITGINGLRKELEMKEVELREKP